MVAHLPAGSPGSGNRRSRRQRVSLSMGDYEKLLDDKPTTDAWGWTARQVKQEKRRVAKLKSRLTGRPADEWGGLRGGICCSSRWADDNWHDRAPYPPGGDQTRMQPCKCCGAMVPPQNVGSSGACDDCRLASMTPGQLAALPSSPGVIDMGRLKAAIRKGGKTAEA